LVPELEVEDTEWSLSFYVGIIGFEIEYSRPESKFFYLSFHGSQIMLCELKQPHEWGTGPMEHPYGRGINLAMSVPAIGPILERLKNHNIPTFRGPYETWYPVQDNLEGSNEFLVQDPDGYLLRFEEDLGTKENLEGWKKSVRKELNL
jgi:hypothetical protein